MSNRLPSKKIMSLPPPSVKIVNSTAGQKAYFDAPKRMLIGGKGGIMKNKQY